MKSLITGASGFIGKRLCDLLTKQDYSIRTVSRTKIVSHHDSLICDIEKEELPKKSLDGIDTIFHLAGYAHDVRQLRNKDRYFSLNVDSTLKIANQALKSGVGKFIYVSSVKAGEFDGLEQLNRELSESSENIYGLSKKTAELALLDLVRNRSMSVTIVRPSLVYGPNVKGNLHAMKSAINGGWFPPLPNLSNSRSMIHVDDVARLLLFISLDDRANGQTYIATDGQSYSSSDIYEILCKSLGRGVPKFRIPLFLLQLLSKTNSNISYKINKILGDEAYDSSGLNAIDFKVKYTLEDLNEEAF